MDDSHTMRALGKHLQRSPAPSLGEHHLNKLLIVDLAISIAVSLPNHLVHLLLRELLAQVGHHMAQLQRDAQERVVGNDMEPPTWKPPASKTAANKPRQQR